MNVYKAKKNCLVSGHPTNPIYHTCDKFQGHQGDFPFISGRFIKKCIEYIGKFLIKMREISKFWLKAIRFRRNFRAHFREFP